MQLLLLTVSHTRCPPSLGFVRNANLSPYLSTSPFLLCLLALDSRARVSNPLSHRACHDAAYGTITKTFLATGPLTAVDVVTEYVLVVISSAMSADSTP